MPPKARTALTSISSDDGAQAEKLADGVDGGGVEPLLLRLVFLHRYEAVLDARDPAHQEPRAVANEDDHVELACSRIGKDTTRQR